MAGAPQGRLDRFARWSAWPRLNKTARTTNRQPLAGRSSPAHEVHTQRYSRTRAVRLATLGAVSLSLGLGRVTPSHAQSQSDCKTQCYDKYLDRNQRDIAACGRLYRYERWQQTDPGWERFKAVVKAGGWSFVRGWIHDQVIQGCYQRASNAALEGFERCDDACEETCTKSLTRSPQGSGMTNQTCHAPDPPKSTPPTPPPAPNPANDPCAACNTQPGAICCGPAPLGKPPCGCASYDPDGPETPCQRVGCG